MVNDWENKVFDSLPFAGTSWAPETANENKGEFIIGERPKSDGTSLLLEAFVEAVITQNNLKTSQKKGIMQVCSVCWDIRHWKKNGHSISLMSIK